MTLAVLFLWIIVGIMVLCGEDISRLQYALVWIALIAELLFKFLKEKIDEKLRKDNY